MQAHDNHYAGGGAQRQVMNPGLREVCSLLVALIAIAMTLVVVSARSAAATTLADGSAAAIVSVASAEPDGKPSGGMYNKYNDHSGLNWCGYFVVWCARKAGVPSMVIPTDYRAAGLASYYQSNNLWHDYTYIAKAGDLIFYSNSSGGHICHVGLVTGVSNGCVCTKEGNTGSGEVGTLTTYKAGSQGAPRYGWYIVGYGSPLYALSSIGPFSSGRFAYRMKTSANGDAVAQLTGLSETGRKRESVKVPKSVQVEGVALDVTTVKARALKDADNLKTATVGNSVKKIGKAAFKGCDRLKTVTIGRSVKKIAASVFSGCKRLKTLTIKSKNLTASRVRNALEGSKIQTIKVKVGSKWQNKRYAKEYSQIFKKSNCGKKIKVKAA